MVQSMDDGITYKDTALAPATSPLATDARDPGLTAVRSVANVHLGLNPDAHTEVKLEGRGGQSQRGGNIVIVEVVEKVVRRDPVLDGGLVARALEQMLTLTRRILRAHLLAIQASGRQALVSLLGLELGEGRMDLGEWDLRQVGVRLLGLLALGGRSAGRTRHGADVLGDGSSGAMGGAGAVDTGIRSEAQVGVLVGVERGGLGIDTGRADISGGLVLALALVADVQVGVVTAVVLTGAVTVTAGTVGNIAAVAARDVLLGAIMTLSMLLQR